MDHYTSIRQNIYKTSEATKIHWINKKKRSRVEEVGVNGTLPRPVASSRIDPGSWPGHGPNILGLGFASAMTYISNFPRGNPLTTRARVCFTPCLHATSPRAVFISGRSYFNNFRVVVLIFRSRLNSMQEDFFFFKMTLLSGKFYIKLKDFLLDFLLYTQKPSEYNGDIKSRGHQDFPF